MQFPNKSIFLGAVLLAFALWLVTPVSAAAETYYVSPNGDDNNAGGETAPWRTLGHAAHMAQAGDTVLIREGTYTEILRPHNSGVAGAPIVFTAYPGERPVIDGGADSGGAWGGLVEIEDVEHVEISRLRLINGAYFGVMVTGSAHVVVAHNQIDYTYSSGIYISDSRHIVVDGNDVQRACHGVGGKPPHYAPQEHITVRNGTEDFQIINNIVSNPHNGRGKEGINIKEGAAHGIVRGNRVFGMSRTGLYVDAYDAYVTDLEISDNEVYHSLHGLVIASEQGGQIERINVIGNHFYDNAHNGIWITGYRVGGPMRELTLYGNRIYGNGDHGISVTNRDATGVTITTNVVFANATSQIEIDRGVPAPLLERNATR